MHQSVGSILRSHWAPAQIDADALVARLMGIEGLHALIGVHVVAPRASHDPSGARESIHCQEHGKGSTEPSNRSRRRHRTSSRRTKAIDSQRTATQISDLKTDGSLWYRRATVLNAFQHRTSATCTTPRRNKHPFTEQRIGGSSSSRFLFLAPTSKFGIYINSFRRACRLLYYFLPIFCVCCGLRTHAAEGIHAEYQGTQA